MKFLIIFFSIFLFADIKIYTITKTVNGDYKTTLFIKNKKIINKFKARLFYPILENKTYYITEGGNNRGSYLLVINKKSGKYSIMELNMFQKIRIKNNYLIFSENYDDLFLTSFVYSPWIDIVATIKNTKLILVPKLMKNKYKPKIIHPFITNNGFLTFKEEKIYPTINSILYYLYIGNDKKAAKIIKKYIKFQNRAQISVFLQDLLEAIKESYFYYNILDNNHYYEYGCDSNDCKKYYYHLLEIKTDLFKKILKEK
jgi:hypothetical protein